MHLRPDWPESHRPPEIVVGKGPPWPDASNPPPATARTCADVTPATVVARLLDAAIVAAVDATRFVPPADAEGVATVLVVDVVLLQAASKNGVAVIKAALIILFNILVPLNPIGLKFA